MLNIFRYILRYWEYSGCILLDPKIMCERSSRPDDARHWRVLEGLYLADSYTTAEAIAQREHIDKRTVYKDIDVCVADLTALFFGVGGIENP